MSGLRVLTVGETDDVWLTTSANQDLSAATVEVRSYPEGGTPGAWGSASNVTHPTSTSISVAYRVTDAVEGTYVVQSKIEIGPLVIIESGYYWVTQL